MIVTLPPRRTGGPAAQLELDDYPPAVAQTLAAMANVYANRLVTYRPLHPRSPVPIRYPLARTVVDLAARHRRVVEVCR